MLNSIHVNRSRKMAHYLLVRDMKLLQLTELYAVSINHDIILQNKRASYRKNSKQSELYNLVVTWIITIFADQSDSLTKR